MMCIILPIVLTWHDYLKSSLSIYIGHDQYFKSLASFSFGFVLVYIIFPFSFYGMSIVIHIL